jgi:hypothetical protein
MQRVGREGDEGNAVGSLSVIPNAVGSSAANLTANSSRQNMVLIHEMERGPNAFCPMSAYERKPGSDKMTRAERSS